jgi:hypothetical protein
MWMYIYLALLDIESNIVLTSVAESKWYRCLLLVDNQ